MAENDKLDAVSLGDGRSVTRAALELAYRI